MYVGRVQATSDPGTPNLITDAGSLIIQLQQDALKLPARQVHTMLALSTQALRKSLPINITVHRWWAIGGLLLTSD